MNYAIATHRPGKFYTKRYNAEDGHLTELPYATKWKTRKAAERTCEFLHTLRKFSPTRYDLWHVVEIAK